MSISEKPRTCWGWDSRRRITNCSAKPCTGRIGRALPTNIVSGVASSTNFNAIWDWNDASSVLPATSFAWTGWPNSDDLKVQRVNLSPLFVHLLLTTYSSAGSPRYSIDSTSWSTALVITNNLTIVDSYFIQDSAVVLYKHTGDTDSQQILIRDSSFVYDQNVWRGSILGGFFLAGLDVASVVDQYLSAPSNNRAQNGTNQQSIVVQAMKTYMDRYGDWALAGFPHGNNPEPPTYTAAKNAQVAMLTAVQDQCLANSHNPTNVPLPVNTSRQMSISSFACSPCEPWDRSAGLRSNAWRKKPVSRRNGSRRFRRTADGPRPQRVGGPRRSGEARCLRARQPAANRDGSRSDAERTADGPRPQRVDRIT